MGALTLRDRLIEIADEFGNDAEFARLAKVSRAAVSQWRSGEVKTLKAFSAVNIQERTGYSVRWLVLGIGPKKLTGKVEHQASSLDTEQKLTPKDEHKFLVVLRAFLDTDEEGRQQIMDAAQAVIGNGSAGQQDRRPRAFKRR